MDDDDEEKENEHEETNDNHHEGQQTINTMLKNVHRSEQIGTDEAAEFFRPQRQYYEEENDEDNGEEFFGGNGEQQRRGRHQGLNFLNIFFYVFLFPFNKKFLCLTTFLFTKKNHKFYKFATFFQYREFLVSLSNFFWINGFFEK